MQQLLSSKISFGQIETPGWSSIVITKVNTDLLPTKFSSPKILDCLPKTINIDFAEKKYSKIKISLPKPCTHNNVIDDFIHDNHSQKND